MAPAQKKSQKGDAAVAKATKVAKAVKNAVNTKRRTIRTSCRFRGGKRTTPKVAVPKLPSKSRPGKPRQHVHNIIRAPLTTETAMKKIEEQNTLVFLCHTRATKRKIRDAIKALYDVDAARVNTLIRPDGIKKAYVHLAPEYDALDIANKIGIL